MFESLFKKCFWHIFSPVHNIISSLMPKFCEKDTNALHLQRMILSDFPSEMVLLQGLQGASRWNISQEAHSGTWASNISQEAPGVGPFLLLTGTAQCTHLLAFPAPVISPSALLVRRSRFPCCVLLTLSWNKAWKSNYRKLSRAIN